MSFLSGLFGGGGDYGAGGFLNDYRTTLGQEQGLAGQFGNVAGQAGADFSRYNGGYNDALTNYAKLLQTDPFTDAYSTAKLNQASNGLTGDYLGAKAALTADLARRGLAAPGAPSSMLTGGLAALDASRASTLANLQNNLALQKIALRRQNDAQLTDLYGGAANTAFGRESGALGAQGGLFGGIGQQEMDLYQNARQRQAQHASGILGFLGNLAGAAGSIFGGPAGGAAASGLVNFAGGGSGTEQEPPVYGGLVWPGQRYVQG